MIKFWAAGFVVGLAAVGCGGGITKQELDTVRQELLAHDAQQAAQLKSELTGVDQKYVTVQQLQMKIEKQLDELNKLQASLTELGKSLDARVTVANENVLKALQFEEKMMSERLAELRQLIGELKRK